LTDENLAVHITFERSEDKTEREQAYFEMNLCDTSGRPRGQVLSSFIAHGRKKERKKNEREGDNSDGEHGMSEDA